MVDENYNNIECFQLLMFFVCMRLQQTNMDQILHSCISHAISEHAPVHLVFYPATCSIGRDSKFTVAFFIHYVWLWIS